MSPKKKSRQDPCDPDSSMDCIQCDEQNIQEYAEVDGVSKIRCLPMCSSSNAKCKRFATSRHVTPKQHIRSFDTTVKDNYVIRYAFFMYLKMLMLECFDCWMTRA